MIQSPANGSQFREGDQIAVQSVASDTSGVTRIELFVDGALAQAGGDGLVLSCQGGALTPQFSTP